jgi:hypothetical protein
VITTPGRPEAFAYPSAIYAAPFSVCAIIRCTLELSKRTSVAKRFVGTKKTWLVFEAAKNAAM